MSSYIDKDLDQPWTENGLWFLTSLTEHDENDSLVNYWSGQSVNEMDKWMWMQPWKSYAFVLSYHTLTISDSFAFRSFWCLSARLQHLQCISNWDTAVLHKAMDLCVSSLWNILSSWFGTKLTVFMIIRNHFILSIWTFFYFRFVRRMTSFAVSKLICTRLRNFLMSISVAQSLKLRNKRQQIWRTVRGNVPSCNKKSASCVLSFRIW